METEDSNLSSEDIEYMKEVLDKWFVDKKTQYKDVTEIKTCKKRNLKW